ncbi:MAG: hypothetical protein PVJ60_09055 [Phycisphaerales bacterium]
MKTKRCWIYVIAAVVSLSVFAAAIVFAQEGDRVRIQEEFRRRLSDSNGVFVYVDVITRERSQKESMTEQLQSDVERELQDSEIKILTEDELEYALGRPRLAVYLVMYKDQAHRDAYLYSFRVVHFEDATLARNFRYAEGICWNSGFYVGRDRTRSIIRLVRTQVRKYIKDYLAANPKPPERTEEGREY